MNLRTLTAAAAVLILAASCTSGTEGIFASIEREQKIVSLGGLSKSATVTSMAEFSGRYYATGGKALFTRAVNGTTWDKGGVKEQTEVQAVGSTSTDLFVIAAGKLFQWVAGDWSEKAIPGGETAYNLVPILKDDGASTTELLLVTASAGAKNVVYRITGGVFVAADLRLAGAGLSAAVTSAVFDGSHYYLASENFVWKLDNGFATPSRLTLTGAVTSGYAGLLYVAAQNTLYLSTLSNGTAGGSVYSAPLTPPLAGTTLSFSPIANADTLKVGSNPVTFGQFLSNSTNNSIWVATGATIGQEGTGYMEITGTSLSVTPNTDLNNYTSSAIKTFSIGTLFKGTDGTYFLGTVAHGLWIWDTSKKIWSQQ